MPVAEDVKDHLMDSQDNARAIGFSLLQEVLIKKNSLSAIESDYLSYVSVQDRAWIKTLCYGVLREYFGLENLARNYLTQSLKSKDQDVFIILLMGLYQIRFMSVSDHAVVFETVELLDLIDKNWAKGLINACLRKDLRDKPKFKKIYGPDWWVKNLKKYFPEKEGKKNNWESILKNSDLKAPIFLRINTQKVSALDYLKLLEEQDIQAVQRLDLELENCLELKSKNTSILELPGYSDGWFYVQDLSLHYVPKLLNLKSGLKILDACSAPGGKALSLLEQEKNLDLICLDSDLNRLERLKENFKRVGLVPQVLCVDLLLEAPDFVSPLAGETGLKDGIFQDREGGCQLFDRILLDAPCSATGVIRRHPDILFLRKESDLKRLPRDQEKILENLSGCLKLGGLLLYTTCSVLPIENDYVLGKFLLAHPEFEKVDFELPLGTKTKFGWQIFPGDGANPEADLSGGDGFYYGLLRRMV